jgi:hypothetical protein
MNFFNKGKYKLSKGVSLKVGAQSLWLVARLEGLSNPLSDGLSIIKLSRSSTETLLQTFNFIHFSLSHHMVI